MKRIALVFIAIALVYGIRANAQAPKRIQFAKGKSSTVVRGITGVYGITYVEFSILNRHPVPG
jgi:hypothetical protein